MDPCRMLVWLGRRTVSLYYRIGSVHAVIWQAGSNWAGPVRIPNLLRPRVWYKIHAWSDKGYKRTVDIFAWRKTWNYAYTVLTVLNREFILFKFFDYNPYSSLCDTLPVAKNNGSVFLAFYMIDHGKYSKQSAQFSTLL